MRKDPRRVAEEIVFWKGLARGFVIDPEASPRDERVPPPGDNVRNMGTNMRKGAPKPGRLRPDAGARAEREHVDDRTDEPLWT